MPENTIRPMVSSDKPAKAKVVRPRRGARSAMVWAGVGFIAGAVFWHAVGFWSFLSDVVLKGASSMEAQIALAASPRAATAAREKADLPTIYLVDPANCTAVVLDRLSKRTVVRPCPPSGLALRLEPEGGREDMADLAPPNIQSADYHPN